MGGFTNHGTIVTTDVDAMAKRVMTKQRDALAAAGVSL
jgi:hypothetical protein